MTGGPTAPQTRRLSSLPVKENCMLCGEANLDHQVTTFAENDNIHQMILELQDSTLLLRVCGFDPVTVEEAKYHMKCITKLRNRYKKLTSKECQETCEREEEKVTESQAFIELVDYIRSSAENDKLMFLLSELHTMYVKRLATLEVHKTVKKTRLKNSLLEHLPGAQEQFSGKQIVIIFKKAIEGLLKDAVQQKDYSEDALILAKASAIVRREIFSHERFTISGHFTNECQEISVPPSLKSPISMILNGLNIENNETQDTQRCLTVCQTILFNAKGRSTRSKTGQKRHTKSREPPLPLYIAFSIHALTRSKTLINKMYHLGQSVSYQRILELEESLATSISERFEKDGCVAPACLRKGIFTIGALDNLDYNPSSTTATLSFHGTGISMFQLPTESNPGEERPPVTLLTHGTGHTLLEECAIVRPVELDTSKAAVPPCSHSHHRCLNSENLR